MLKSNLVAKSLATAVCITGGFLINGQAFANDHNSYIPSDTPFYIGTGEGLPVDLMLAFSPVGKIPVPDDSEAGAIDSVTNTLNNLDKILPEWGIGDALHFSAYAVGIYPVLRVQLDDSEKFDAALARLETEQDLKPRVIERTGFKVKVFDRSSGDVTEEKANDAESSEDLKTDAEEASDKNADSGFNPGVVVASSQRDLIVGLVHNTDDNALLDRVLGITKPASVMIDSARLEAVRKRWGYGKQLAAYLDLSVIADILTTDQSAAGKDLHALSLSSTEMQSRLQMMRSEPCRSEITAVAKDWPMLVSGLRKFEFDEDELQFTSHFAGEIVNEQFNQTLQLLRGVIPASQSAAKALLSIGLGLSVDNLTQFIGQMSNFLSEMKYECPALSGLNRLSATDLSSASMGVVMFGGLARGVEGLSVNIFDMAFAEENAPLPVSGADLAMVVNAKDPTVLIQTLQMMPQLGMLAELPLDGSEVSLNAMLPIPLPDGVELKAAVKENNIVIFTGDKSSEYVARLSNNNKQGLFRAQLDTASLMERFTAVMRVIGQGSDELDDTVDFLKEYPTGLIDYSVDFTDNGVELLSSGIVKRLPVEK